MKNYVPSSDRRVRTRTDLEVYEKLAPQIRAALQDATTSWSSHSAAGEYRFWRSLSGDRDIAINITVQAIRRWDSECSEVRRG